MEDVEGGVKRLQATRITLEFVRKAKVRMGSAVHPDDDDSRKKERRKSTRTVNVYTVYPTCRICGASEVFEVRQDDGSLYYQDLTPPGHTLLIVKLKQRKQHKQRKQPQGQERTP